MGVLPGVILKRALGVNSLVVLACYRKKLLFSVFSKLESSLVEIKTLV